MSGQNQNLDWKAVLIQGLLFCNIIGSSLYLIIDSSSYKWDTAIVMDNNCGMLRTDNRNLYICDNTVLLKDDSGSDYVKQIRTQGRTLVPGDPLIVEYRRGYPSRYKLPHDKTPWPYVTANVLASTTAFMSNLLNWFID